MKKDKMQAITDFKKMIFNSWTYDRMTRDERERLALALDGVQAHEIKGNYNARIAALNLAYNSFLLAIGYTGFKWREKHPENIPF